MKRSYESGASKRRRKIASEIAIKAITRPITSFLEQSSHSSSVVEATGSETSENQKSISEREYSQDNVTATNTVTKNQTSSSVIEVLDLNDIGTIDKKNVAHMESFLKITAFEFPSTIPRDAENHAFPVGLLQKILPNGEACTRDWLCWSTVKQSLYCAPCFILRKSDTNMSLLSNETGWDISRGWRKLKDRIPSHESSTIHKENDVAWKSAIRSASADKTITSLLLAEINSEVNSWKKNP